MWREWAASHRDELGALAATFLAASEEAERQREQAAMETERRLREAAEAAREAERRRAEEAIAATEKEERLSRRLLVAAVVASLFAVASGGLGWWANEKRIAADTAAEAEKNATQKAETAAREEKKAKEKAIAEAKRADEAAKIAESRRLAVLSEVERPNRLDTAMLLAIEAVNASDTLEAQASLQRSIIARPEVSHFLHVAEGGVTSVAFGPDGRLAAGYRHNIIGANGLLDGVFAGGVVVFDAGGRRLRPEPLEVKEGSVTSVAFGTDGRLAAGCDIGVGGVVVLFDPAGRRLQPKPLAVNEGDVTSVAFGPEGCLAVGYGVGGAGGVVVFDAKGRRLRPKPPVVNGGDVMSVAFGPDGHLAAGYRGHGLGNHGGVMVFDAELQQLRPEPLEVKEGDVTSVAFGPDGRLAAGYRHNIIGTNGLLDGVFAGGVVVFDAGGRRLRPEPLEVKEGSVTSVAFDADFRLAAGYFASGYFSRPGGFIPGAIDSGVMVFDAELQQLRPEPLEVKEGDVTSVAFGPDGRLAAGYFSTERRAGGFAGGVVVFDAKLPWLGPGRPLRVAEGRVVGRDEATGVSFVERFDADPASWKRKLGQVANRNLTRKECADYFPDRPYRRTIRSLPWPRDLPEDERSRAEAWEKDHPEEEGA